MERILRELSYLGRLIAGKAREWARLIVLARETAAVAHRRDQLIFRLGARYREYMSETGAEPPKPVADIAADLNAVLQRVAAINDMKLRLREETRAYVQGETEPVPRLPVRQPPPAPSRLEVVKPEPAPKAGLDLPEEFLLGPTRRAVIAEDKCECGALFPTEAGFCPNCGRPRPQKTIEVSTQIAPVRKCPLCGAELPIGVEFCPICGGHVDAEVYDV